jgi:hypothetical protein
MCNLTSVPTELAAAFDDRVSNDFRKQEIDCRQESAAMKPLRGQAVPHPLLSGES